VVDPVADAPPVFAGGGASELPAVLPLVAPPLVGAGPALPGWEGPTAPDEHAAIAAKPIVLASTIAAE